MPQGMFKGSPWKGRGTSALEERPIFERISEEKGEEFRVSVKKEEIKGGTSRLIKRE